MKFTSKEFMEWLGLSVGDRIKIDNKIFEIYVSPQNELRCVNIHNSNNHFYLKNLIDKDIEILPRPKRVGDKLCNLKCKECELRSLNYCNGDSQEGHCLFNVLEQWADNEWCFDQEIYDLLKTRLDKEVE